MNAKKFLPSITLTSFLVLLFTLSISLVGVTFGYFAGSQTSVKNYNVAPMTAKAYTSSLSGSNVSVGSEYTSSSTVSAGGNITLTIQNTSKVDKVLLRVNYSVKIGTTDTVTNDYNMSLVNPSTYSTVGGSQANAGFTEIENGWYYYNAALTQNQYAPFATFSNIGSSAVHIQLNIEVVQASLDIAQNYWNYHSGYTDNLLGDPYTVDGLDMTANSANTTNGIAVFVPDGAGWKAATSSSKLNATYTSGNTTMTIPTLTGTSTNNYMRIYNNSATPIILALRMRVTLNDNAAWVSGSFQNTLLKVNFANNSRWVDIRNGTGVTAFTFGGTTSQYYVSFLYNELLMPGQSVYAMTNTVDLINAPSVTGDYIFHFTCEVLGYNASESSWVDNYLAVTGSGSDVSGDDDINVGIDRVPLYYNYNTTDNTSPVYSSHLPAGKYDGSANYYSQYAIWYNIISPTLT